MIDEKQVGKSWYKLLKDEFQKEYFIRLKSKINNLLETKTVFPSSNNIFNAFIFTPFEKVKVVIIGQDPYHKWGQAHGLVFSVPPETKIPPSLRNIFKELLADLKIDPPQNGYLESWARQGVFLLNAILTVEEGNPLAHKGLGWEIFTDKVIRTISEQREGVVFLLWGRYAREKKSLIESSKHLILEAVHPSPLSASRGFLGCGHFSKANRYLRSIGKKEVDWVL